MLRIDSDASCRSVLDFHVAERLSVVFSRDHTSHAPYACALAEWLTSLAEKYDFQLPKG